MRVTPACPARRAAAPPPTARRLLLQQRQRAPRPASARPTRDCTHFGADYTCVNNTCAPGNGGGRDLHQPTRIARRPDLRQRRLPANPTNPTGCTTNARVRPRRPLRQRPLQERLHATRDLRHRPDLLGGHCVSRPERRRAVRHRADCGGQAPASTAPATAAAPRTPTAPTTRCLRRRRLRRQHRPHAAVPQQRRLRRRLECVNARCRAHCFNSNDCQLCGAGGNMLLDGLLPIAVTRRSLTAEVLVTSAVFFLSS